MKKILHLILLLTASVAAMSCQKKDASLAVSPLTLAFDATSTDSQSVNIDAVELNWEYAVAEASRYWIVVDKTSNGLSVTVKTNYSAKERVGVIAIRPLGVDNIPPVSVVVTQGANPNPVAPVITADPMTLNFTAEGAEPQEAVISMSQEGYKWDAKSSEGWITIESQDGKIVVALEDNIRTEERRGVITVSSTSSGAEPIMINVVQEAYDLVPTITPESLTLNYKARETGSYVAVAANVDYYMKTLDYKEKPINWLTATPSMEKGRISIKLSINADTTKERRGYIVFYSRVDNAELSRIEVVQEKAREGLSELEGNVTVDDTYIAFVALDGTNDINSVKPSTWTINLLTNGMTYTNSRFPRPTSGSGDWIRLEMYSPTVLLDPEKRDYIPDGTYTVQTIKSEYDTRNEWSVTSGRGVYYIPSASTSTVFGSWYYKVENGETVVGAPLSSGTVTVKRDADTDEYTITIDIVDDLKFTIKSTTTGKITQFNYGTDYDANRPT